MNIKNITKLSALSVGILSSFTATADQQILDDLIVDGSICVGQDCVNGESFGFDTLRLKENNLRIKAQDTSNSASFPSRDWQITFNDSSNGGANKFSIDDIDGGRTPFTIEASAPSNSLYVDDGGRIGFGTATPVVELHLVSGDSPTLRLEQDGSSGFTAQTWDVAGNETNFFVRDASNGSTLPFRIKPHAPTDSLSISANGNIGVGTSNPGATLEVQTAASNANSSDFSLSLKNTNPATTQAFQLKLENQGSSYISFKNTSILDSELENQLWSISNHEGDFHITNPLNNFREFTLEQNGTVRVGGEIYANGIAITSSKYSKENFKSIDKSEIISKISNLEIQEWNYIKNNDDVKHIGPIAEEFHDKFGLNGSINDKISVSDLSGISLAAIQELISRSDEQAKEIKKLKKQILKIKD
ncbi:tail fiber domain-containing protein [Colwellia sp. RSH04]|uniref:tail fiber domain-containing protein n=1 Tax=Colwellia sp. RSH04 TaxID=2305464 RepID=UPI0015FAE061|nr:tail fiber domain-containing protein [Colwellia sp. RSH04]